MEEKKFKELLLENNKILINEIDKKTDQKIEKAMQKMDTTMDQKIEIALEKNNKILMREMDKIIDHKIEKNNKVLIQQMEETMDQKIDTSLEKNNKVLMQQMENMINKSEERQNGKLAYLEFTYGEKISAIFDKIQSIEDMIKENQKQSEKYWKKVDRHDDILYSYDLRISKLEGMVNSN